MHLKGEPSPRANLEERLYAVELAWVHLLARLGCTCFAIYLLLLGLYAAGCMIGPDFRRPPAPVGKQWAQTGEASLATRGRNEEFRDWWSVFNDPVLTRLVQTAYRNNLTLRQAGVRVLEARAQLGIAIGEFFPQQQYLSAAVSNNRIPTSVPYSITNHTWWSDSFAMTAGWEVDVWGKLRRAIQSADDSFLASVADYDNVLVTLTGDVAGTYVQIRTLAKRVAIARQNASREKEVLEIVKDRHDEGVVSGRDVYQAENVLASTEATVPQLTAQLEQSKYALAILIGLPAENVESVLDSSTEIPSAPDRVTVGIPADLLRRRPDVRQAELQAAAQCAQIGYAKADLLPGFTLFGTVGTFASTVSNNYLGNVFSTASLAYTVGPQLQWNILNYGQITNNVRLQDARFQELIVAYQNAVLKAQQEVENGISAFIQSKAALVYLREAEKAAEDALSIAVTQYKEGILDFTTVLTAQQNLLAAQNNLAIGSGAVPQGLIAIYRAMGGGWQIREGHNFVPAATGSEMAKRTNWGQLLTPDLMRPSAPGLPTPRNQAYPVRLPEW